jgi:acyl-coenzyme A synthetase/AMP-(fatty) acid ligase
LPVLAAVVSIRAGRALTVSEAVERSRGPPERQAGAPPRRVEFANELPKALTGKVRLVELREAERVRAGSAG